MTIKEALKEYKEIYIDKTFKGNECPSQEWYFKIIKQDLERLEKLEDNIKIHKETIKMQHSQIESLQSENEKMNKQLDVFFDKLDKNTIRALDLISYDLYDENSKLKKVIEILKSYDLKVEYVEGYYTQPIIKFNHTYNEGVVGITIEEFELLKEYL